MGTLRTPYQSTSTIATRKIENVPASHVMGTKCQVRDPRNGQKPFKPKGLSANRPREVQTKVWGRVTANWKQKGGYTRVVRRGFGADRQGAVPSAVPHTDEAAATAYRSASALSQPARRTTHSVALPAFSRPVGCRSSCSYIELERTGILIATARGTGLSSSEETVRKRANSTWSAS